MTFRTIQQRQLEAMATNPQGEKPVPPTMITEFSDLRGKTIRGVLDRFDDGVLLVFTDNTAAHLEHCDDDNIYLNWRFPTHWIGQDGLDRDKAIDNGLCTADEWDTEVERRAKIERQFKLEEFNRLKAELGL